MQPFHPQGRQETEIEEEEELPLELMHVPSTVEVAEMFSPIEELTSNLGLHIALGHLYKAKHKFLRVIARRPKRRQTELKDFLLHRVEFQAR